MNDASTRSGLDGEEGKGMGQGNEGCGILWRSMSRTQRLAGFFYIEKSKTGECI